MILKTGGRLLICLLIMCYMFLFLYRNELAAQPNAKLLKEEKEDFNDIASLLKEIKRTDAAAYCARKAVEAFPDSSFLPALLFNLSEWELRSDKLHYNLDMEKYDVKMRFFEKDSAKFPEPEEPMLNYQETLKLNQRILNEFSGVAFLDKVKYRTGICLYEIGERDSAKILFLELAEEHPDSFYTPEVIFRIGECYFDEGEFEKALETYNQILEIWDSPFFAMTLYKRAWCYYRLNDLPQAISTFFYLLNDIKLLESLDSEILGKSQVELRDEAYEYIAISFTDFGGESMALNFIKNVGGAEYSPYILDKMAKVYFERDFCEEAISVNKNILKIAPLYENNPQVHYNLFKCYEKLGETENTLKIRNAIVRKNGPNSAWAKKNSSDEAREKVIEIIESIDFVIATPYLNRADSIFSVENYEKAVQVYKKFLKTFSKDKRADHAAYFLAESLYELGNYKASALAYQHVTKKFPESEMAEDAAFNRIICYSNLLTDNANAKPIAMAWKQSGKLYKIQLESKNQKKVVLACKDFINWFPKSEKSIEVKLKLVDTFMRLEQYKLSEKLLMGVLVAIRKNKRGPQFYAKALNLMAQACFKQESFRKAEKWYALLIKEYPDSTELVERSKTMLASASFKVGEALKENGNAGIAALKFERAAAEAVDVKVAEAALFEAAVQFEKAAKFRRAAINFEGFCRKYPDSDKYDEALYRSATLREKLFQWYLAAKNYQALYKRDPNSAKGASALFNAGISYENAKDWTSMAQIFSEFTNKFPNEVDKLLEARFKIGYAYEQSRKIPQATQIYKQIVDNYNRLLAQGEFADDFVAAQAQFRMGEIKHKEFSAIKLKPPFQQNLKRKQLAFNKMIEQCVQVAKYNVADWTTAAFYSIGYGYEEFCQDILNSSAPPDLTKEQLNEYWDMIHQKWVLPLQGEALKYYKTNLKLAVENNMENDWTKKTKDRALFLAKKLATFKGTPDEKLKKAIDTAENSIKEKKTDL